MYVEKENWFASLVDASIIFKIQNTKRFIIFSTTKILILYHY